MRITLLTIITLFLILPSSDVIYSQHDKMVEVYDGRFVQNVFWISDEALVFSAEFEAPSYELPAGSWIVYEINSEELTLYDTWHLMINLTDDELTTFSSMDSSFMYISPNERYLIYAPYQDELRLPMPFAIGDRDEMQIHLEADQLMDPFSGPDNFSILWSKNNISFVVKTSTGLVGYYRFLYVSNFDSDLSNANVVAIDRITLGERLFITNQVFDISDDGRFLLVEASEVNLDTGDYAENYLLLWDTQNPDNTQILSVQDTAISGGFCPSGEDRIAYLTKDGLYEYDIANSANLYLDRFLEEGIVNAYFSPNGQHLAIVQEAAFDSFESKLYVVDLMELELEDSQCF